MINIWNCMLLSVVEHSYSWLSLRMDGIRDVCTDVSAIQFSIYPSIGTIVYCYLITLDTMSILVILIAAYKLFFSKLTYFRVQNNKSELMKEMKNYKWRFHLQMLSLNDNLRLPREASLKGHAKSWPRLVSKNIPYHLAWRGKCLRCRDNHRT